MGSEEYTPLELAQETFQVVSDVAVKLAVDSKNRAFGKLGCLLAIVGLKDVTTLSHRQAEIYEAKIEVVLDQVERACTWPKNARTKGYPTLQALARKEADLKKINHGLKELVKRTHEFEALLTILEQTQTIQELTPEDMGLDADPATKKNNVPGYPPHVNEALYVTLDVHTSCDCPIQHLKLAKLRLDATEEHDGSQIPFEILFPASPAHHYGANPDKAIWHETMMMVSSKRPVKKRPTKFSQKSRVRQQIVRVEGKEMSFGDFCKHLKAKLGYCLRFNLVFESSEPVLRSEETPGKSLRNVKLVHSLSLSAILQKIGHKMATKEKFHLGYVLAKSVWQYYGSEWMKKPWTHDDIQFLEEQVSVDKTHGKLLSTYNPYFDPNFGNCDSLVGEYCPDGILLHRYPGVLALAIMLLEIIQGQTFGEFEDHQPYNLPKIKDHYKQAWVLVSGSTLDCNIMYKEVIKKCLDGKLFKEAPFDSDNPQNGLEIRRSIIYREIVFPLKHLLQLSSSSYSLDEPILQAPQDVEPLQLHKVESRSSIDAHHQTDFGVAASFVPAATSQQPPAEFQATYRPDMAVSVRSLNRMTSPEPRPFTPDSSMEHTTNCRIPRPASRDDFEIAIICAVKPEYDAVTLLLDEFFDDDGYTYGRAAQDQNTYLTGRIGQYNVVLALLPGMGKANAAQTAANFRSSFGGIELALLVGICGGVPTASDGQEIILGDVIISGSIIQYDLGRQFPNGFRRKSTLNDNLGRANADVRGFVAMLSTCHVSERLEARTSHHLAKLQREASRRHPGKYDYPGPAADKLFEATYLHKHQLSANCEICKQGVDNVCEHAMHGAVCGELHCDESHLVWRKRLDAKAKELKSTASVHEVQQPMLHIGTVASGDTVMRSGEIRDNIAKRDSIIAFEMEGAGVWDNLSCIIIKGVCDYSDCHKNKKWQNFAAATAASAMKAILERYNRRDRSPRPSWDRHGSNSR
ncbi:hypothetical protein H072_8570 [Dactylellina haptotyla CBS 200.50]|uniref:Uncharacterized protein n=1 Tax=Dactylellina haptotyla (strain CBS 200.50) TaxID=1284197 RepID=S8A4K5_DACHA|nr:hypothetical protein H072_8570 [Dactylellina haptotyla CBS 200.50]